MKWWPGKCEQGDMIRVKIGGIYHYGVFVSDDEVVQFGYPPRERRDKNEDIRVVSTTIDEFAGGSIIERAQFSLPERLKRIPPKKTVETAKSRIGEGNYDLIHNNCEHFAYECVFGVHKSVQEEEARRQWYEYVRAKSKANAAAEPESRSENNDTGK